MYVHDFHQDISSFHIFSHHAIGFEFRISNSYDKVNMVTWTNSFLLADSIETNKSLLLEGRSDASSFDS